MFKVQSPSKYSPIYLLRHFLYCSKQFLNSSILKPYGASAVFLFHLFHISKTFPFEKFFHLGKQKLYCVGQDRVNREGGAQGSCHFGQNLLNTQHGVGRCTCKSPMMKWANTLKESSKKNSLKLNTASHNNTSWYTDGGGGPRTLT